MRIVNAALQSTIMVDFIRRGITDGSGSHSPHNDIRLVKGKREYCMCLLWKVIEFSVIFGDVLDRTCGGLQWRLLMYTYLRYAYNEMQLRWFIGSLQIMAINLGMKCNWVWLLLVHSHPAFDLLQWTTAKCSP